MHTNDYVFARAQHQRLLDAACSARTAAFAQGRGATLKDYICLHLGGWLIAFGNRLRAASRLSQETTFAEFSQECS
ncbi:MAG: hypothetical protein PHS96_01565 [Anaerolineales bacterium]|nr:hypothetical protein [Anaerolineales bacterium]